MLRILDTLQAVYVLSKQKEIFTGQGCLHLESYLLGCKGSRITTHLRPDRVAESSRPATVIYQAADSKLVPRRDSTAIPFLEDNKLEVILGYTRNLGPV